MRDEVLVELREGVTADVIARRHRLTVLSTERFTLASATIVRLRVEGNRTARQALADMAGDARIASAQPNFIYALQQSQDQILKQTEEPIVSVEPPLPIGPLSPDLQPLPTSQEAPNSIKTQTEPTPPPVRKPQYSLNKMGIEAAHLLAKGTRIRVVVIDTGVDEAHPELKGVVSGRFDSLAGAGEASESHGTAMAGAIIAKSSLQGVSPAAELLVARAFTGGAVNGDSGAQGTTLHILRSLDWAHAESARVVNLSFAGPQDRLMSRALLGGSTKGMIPVAAVGNGGPQAKPLYPGADPSVIAVTATDADDKIFAQANTGTHITVSAPGVDVIAAEPGERYGFSSGTSIAAAHVSGLIALMLERKADLDLASVRAILSETAVDLGARGPDKVFGAGRINAPAALSRLANPAPSGKP